MINIEQAGYNLLCFIVSREIWSHKNEVATLVQKKFKDNKLHLRESTTKPWNNVHIHLPFRCECTKISEACFNIELW